MYYPSLKDFKRLSQKGNLIPVYAEIPADLDTPVSAFMKIRTGDHDFLLESVQGGEKWAQYSFLGTQPQLAFRSRDKEIEVIQSKKTQKFNTTSDPIREVQKILKNYKPVHVEGLPRFYGGLVGYFGYDTIRFIEDIPQTSNDDFNNPDIYLILTDTVVIFDNLKQSIKIVANVFLKDKKNIEQDYQKAQKKIQKLISKLQGPLHLPSAKKKSSPQVELKPRHTEAQFTKMVDTAKKYIQAGDIFQVVLSTRFEAKTNIEPFALYRTIRRINPSPYLFFLNFDGISIVGASPEVMVRLEDGKVEVRPIAGTRKRGKTPQDDLKLEKELIKDPKERAEHIMLVDLGRNDIGRVSEIGTVNVDEQEVVERYAHVMHLVSHVSGKLKRGKNAFDVLRATFPAGTLSGAPKIRAMEIIEELEGKRRNIYGGCVGYISFNGNMDTAIAIRTAVLQKGKVFVQAGAGIVYNSKPKLEYKECQNKARSLLKAIEETES